MNLAGQRGEVGRLTEADAGELLTLQRAAWVQEALANRTLEIPPLLEDLETVRSGIANHAMTTWGCRDAGRLVATVRTTLNAAGDQAFVGRLGVVPDRQGEGLGARMLRWAEVQLPPTAHLLTLITGAQSVDNHRFYRHMGYEPDPDAETPTGTTGFRKVRSRRPC